MLSSISNETLPLNHSFQHNHNININCEITQFGNDKLVANNGCIDVTEEQEKTSRNIPE